MTISSRETIEHALNGDNLILFFRYLSQHASSFKGKDIPTVSLINNVLAGYLELIHNSFFKNSFKDFILLFRDPKITLIRYISLLINSGFFINSGITPEILQSILKDIENDASTIFAGFRNNRSRKGFYQKLKKIVTSLPKVPLRINGSLERSPLSRIDDLINLNQCGSYGLLNLVIDNMLTHFLQNISMSSDATQRKAAMTDIIPFYYGKYVNDYMISDFENAIKNCETLLTLFREIGITIDHDGILASTKNDLISILNDQAIHALKNNDLTTAYDLFESCKVKIEELGIDSNNIYAARMRLNFIKACEYSAELENNLDTRLELYQSCIDEFTKININIFGPIGLKHLENVRTKLGRIIITQCEAQLVQKDYAIGLNKILELFKIYSIFKIHMLEQDNIYLLSAIDFFRKFVCLALTEEKNIENLINIKDIIESMLINHGVSVSQYYEYLILIDVHIAKLFLAERNVMSALENIQFAKNNITQRKHPNDYESNRNLQAIIDAQTSAIYKVLSEQANISTTTRVEYVNQAISYLKLIPIQFKTNQHLQEQNNLYLARGEYLINLQYNLKEMINTVRDNLRQVAQNNSPFFANNLGLIHVLHHNLAVNCSSTGNHPAIIDDAKLYYICQNIELYKKFTSNDIRDQLQTIEEMAKSIIALRNNDNNMNIESRAISYFRK